METNGSIEQDFKKTSIDLPIDKIPPCIKNLEPIKTVLDTAKELVYGDRAKTYGHPSDNFENIAWLWDAYNKIKQKNRTENNFFYSPIDIACLNILQEVARLACNNAHIDSMIDIAGYAATCEKIALKELM